MAGAAWYSLGMTTTQPLPLADVDTILAFQGMIGDTDYTLASVAGAPHAVAVTVRATGLTTKIARTLRNAGLLIDRDRDLLVASLPQPAAR